MSGPRTRSYARPSAGIDVDARIESEAAMATNPPAANDTVSSRNKKPNYEFVSTTFHEIAKALEQGTDLREERITLDVLKELQRVLMARYCITRTAVEETRKAIALLDALQSFDEADCHAIDSSAMKVITLARAILAEALKRILEESDDEE